MVSRPAYEKTAKETVTLPVVVVTGMISAIGTPRKASGRSGPRTLVTSVLI
jgi:hypothetical protein